MLRFTALIGVGLLALLAGCSSSSPIAEAPPDAVTIEFLADFNIEAGTSFEDEMLGGISAVLYDADADRWIGLSDARRRSRFYELQIELDAESVRVEPTGVVYLSAANGDPVAENVLDPESIVASPWGSFLIATEPDWRSEPVEQAKLLDVDRSGRLVKSFPLPDKFVVEGSPPVQGVRHNFGFESMTLSADGSRLFVAAESTLVQDGPEASFDTPAFCRLIELDVLERELEEVAEYVYPVGPIAPVADFEDVQVFAGLVELVALSDAKLLALERIYIRETGGSGRSLNRIRIFLVDLTDASDVSSIASLEDDISWTPVQKELLVDFDDIVPRLSPGFQSLDNFEAMGLGPELPGGGRSLVVVSDDNFQKTQRSAFLLFRLNEMKP